MGCRGILLVEDNRDDEILTLRALEKHRLRDEVTVARDGVQALDFLFRTGACQGVESQLPQLVLLDLKLPRVDGFEVLQRIRADVRTRRLPVVVLTSSREDGDVLRCYDLGANSYVRKPVDFVEFADAIRHLGVYWLTLNQAPPTLDP
jgi:CheY-like chemotaxis protein